MSTTAQPNNAQKRFDQHYITSTEIRKELGVERSAILHARQRGLLPEPIVVNGAQIFIWERETVRPFVDAWKIMLNVRRGQPA